MNVAICEVCKKVKVKGIWIQFNEANEQHQRILAKIRFRNKKGKVQVEHIRCPECVPW